MRSGIHVIARTLLCAAAALGCQSWQSVRDDAATVSVPENVVFSYLDGQDVRDVRGAHYQEVRLDPGARSFGFIVTNPVGTFGGLWELSHSAACYSEVDLSPSGTYRISYDFALENFRPGTFDASPEFSARIEDATSGEPVGTTYCAHAPESTPWRTCELDAAFPRPKRLYSPDYPNDAMMAGASGFIVIEGKVDQKGRIVTTKRNPRITASSDYDLFGSSDFGGVTLFSGLETVRLWKFDLEPEQIAGRKYSLRCDYRHPATPSEPSP